MPIALPAARKLPRKELFSFSSLQFHHFQGSRLVNLDATYVTPVIRCALRNLASPFNTDILTTSLDQGTGISMKATGTAMKVAPTKKPLIRLAVVESDPLRFV